MAESRIIIFLNEDWLNIPTKNPSEKSAGMVLIPKINITNAPDKAPPVLVAIIAKE